MLSWSKYSYILPPSGTTKHAGILPVIGDLLAICKGMGYISVNSAHNSCTFCMITKKDFDNLDLVLIPHQGIDVRTAAVQWRDVETKVKRNEISKNIGVQWSPFHNLLYCDPVRHTVLGIMHNWYKGVLQYHVRYK
ncbi:hypothetical protein BDQ17DRAFT_1267581 [Cyathus striatus]|nr:hypothetical protein BDQ17DRAFT_1267581 [Cyathus striatus]